MYIVSVCYLHLKTFLCFLLQGALNINDRTIPQPPILQLSVEKLSRDGAFLMDAGSVSGFTQPDELSVLLNLLSTWVQLPLKSVYWHWFSHHRSFLSHSVQWFSVHPTKHAHPLTFKTSQNSVFLFAGTDALGWKKLCTEFSQPSSGSSKLCINSTEDGKLFMLLVIGDLKGILNMTKNMKPIFKSEINTPDFFQSKYPHR